MESTAVDPAIVLDALRVQYVSYLHLSMLALMVHDWLILLDREIEHVWRTQWGINKVLYIISRYGPFLDMPITIVTHIAPYGMIDYNTCNTLYKIATWNTFIGISISESILLLRTNAIYSRSKRVTIPLSVAYAVSAVAGIICTWLYLRNTVFGAPPSDLFSGCTLVRRDAIIFFDFLLLLVFELVVIILTVGRGFRDFHSGTSLLRVVYRDSVSFFLVLFGITLSAILILALAPPQFSGLMGASTRVMHSIICSRILLNLREAVTPNNTSTEVSTGLAFASSFGQRTTQPQHETIRLEVHHTWSGEES
ncbi:hypothetical protein BJ322DRAFT_1208316 [Thelephora terrestris]|uniref:DUF6533 domain-containing protein n=1 Tax=Thelephora terrestris TaxID=56493 RepID=A0A9P6HPS5_9AGAM|nr:hypothetical protein BJ322DRAFT_1208316 [Thelephora terrestris]